MIFRHRKFEYPMSENHLDLPIPENNLIYRYRKFKFAISANHFDFPISVNQSIYRYQKFELPTSVIQHYLYNSVIFLGRHAGTSARLAMPRAAVTPIAPERSEGTIGCDSRPRHCRRDNMPAWRPTKITLLSLLPLNLAMYHRFISFLRAAQSREGR